MRDCIFCQIAHHDIESTVIYENDQVIAFEDIDPQAPLGGGDGGKDILCSKSNTKYVAGVFFAQGDKYYSQVEKKFLIDLD